MDLGEFGKPKYRKSIITFKLRMDAVIDRGKGPEKQHWETTSVEELFKTIRKNSPPEVEKYLQEVLEDVYICESAK